MNFYETFAPLKENTKTVLRNVLRMKKNEWSRAEAEEEEEEGSQERAGGF